MGGPYGPTYGAALESLRTLLYERAYLHMPTATSGVLEGRKRGPEQATAVWRWDFLRNVKSKQGIKTLTTAMSAAI